MASSRKSARRIESDDWHLRIERALKDCLARVCFSTSPPAVAVAYSGGLDSSVLLHWLHRFSQQHPLKVFAFHIHHGLNPQADSWLAHCERIACSFGVSFAACKVVVDAGSGLGVEEAARRARYAALGELCREHGVPLLLIAHHEDDQAETVLMQLLRGAGLPGLSGMPSCMQKHELLGEGVALARPLLTVARRTLEAEAARLALPHIHDDSNDDIAYRRNAIRHRIMPAMRELFPSYSNCIHRSSLHAQQAQRLLEELAGMDLQRSTCSDEQGGLNLDVLRNLSGDRVDNLLRYWLSGQGMHLPSHAQLQQIRRQMLHAVPDSEPLYAGGEFRVRRIGMRLVLEENAGEPPSLGQTLVWRGEASISVPEWKGRLVFQEGAPLGVDAQCLREGAIVLHPRSGQERLKLAANRPSRTLKNLYQEAGLFPAERRWLPLVSLQDRLIFAAGLGMDIRHLGASPGVVLHWEKL